MSKMGNTLFAMMNSSTTGLMTSQVGISISSNNIQNGNTLGYTRQRAVFTSNQPIHYQGTGWLGNGVSTQEIQRLRDSYLDVQLRDETAIYEQASAKYEMLTSLESVIAEPSDVGLNANLDDLWDAWVELSKHPGNSTLQTLVKENSVVVAQKLNELSLKIDNVAKEAGIRKDDAIVSAADLITQINDLNDQLKRMHKLDPHSVPNEMIDTRDLLTQKLAAQMGIDVTVNNDFTVSVEVRLKDGTTVDALALDEQGIKAIEDKISSGAIRGYHEAQTSLTAKYKAEFGKFAESFADEINAIQGFDFFQYDAANPSGTIQVNPDLLSGKVQIVTGTTGNQNDNSVALEIIALRDKQVTIGGENTTFGQFYKDLVADIGTETKQSANGVKNQNIVLEQLMMRFESLSGINVDEEMINLVQFQASYDANARVISTLTEMIDTVLNMGV